MQRMDLLHLHDVDRKTSHLIHFGKESEVALGRRQALHRDVDIGNFRESPGPQERSPLVQARGPVRAGHR